MILVTEQGRREAEARRVAALKAARSRKDEARERGRRGPGPGEEPAPEDGQDAAAGEERRGPLTAAHAAAEGAMGARKASSEADAARDGAQEGPARPMALARPMLPGGISPDQFTRPLIAEGHQAPSPGHEPARHLAQAAAQGVLRPVDVSGSRLTARPVFPQAPMSPQGGQR